MYYLLLCCLHADTHTVNKTSNHGRQFIAHITGALLAKRGKHGISRESRDEREQFSTEGMV